MVREMVCEGMSSSADGLMLSVIFVVERVSFLIMVASSKRNADPTRLPPRDLRFRACNWQLQLSIDNLQLAITIQLPDLLVEFAEWYLAEWSEVSWFLS